MKNSRIRSEETHLHTKEHHLIHTHITPYIQPQKANPSLKVYPHTKSINIFLTCSPNASLFHKPLHLFVHPFFSNMHLSTGTHSIHKQSLQRYLTPQHTHLHRYMKERQNETVSNFLHIKLKVSINLSQSWNCYQSFPRKKKVRAGYMV